MHSSSIRSFSATAILVLSAAAAAGNTAVSETNGKFGAMHGSMDSQDASTVEGSITWPVGDCFGIQLDGLYSNVERRTFGFAPPDDVDYGGVGGHFFWRESDTAMLGLEAGYVFSDAVDSYEIGIEAERYFEWFTVGAKTGFASIDYSRPILGIDDDEEGLFGQLYIGAYPMNNLLITAIVESRFDHNSVGIEVEYELPVKGLSVFASASRGDSNYDQAFVGMRYYFGEDKPLIRRHRESDPRNHLPGVVTGIGMHTKHLQERALRFQQSGGSGGGGGSLGGSGSIGGSISNGASGTVLGPGNSPGVVSGNFTSGSGNTTISTGTLTLSGSGTFSNLFQLYGSGLTTPGSAILSGNPPPVD